VSGRGLVQWGGVARCVSRYITWIEVSGSVGDQQGCTVMWEDLETIICMKRSVKHVERTCEEISVCNTWEVQTCDSVLEGMWLNDYE